MVKMVGGIVDAPQKCDSCVCSKKYFKNDLYFRNYKNRVGNLYLRDILLSNEEYLNVCS